MNDAIFPTRSKDGLSALDIFYDDFNDVHFFFEDIDQENLYETILRKIFPKLKIARVFPLGGKCAVLKRLNEEATEDSRPRSVYVVDKDFDDILGTKKQKPMLFYLSRYCIENYFTEPDALLEVVLESAPKLKRKEVSARLDLEAKIVEFMESLRPLFQLFFCVQRFELDLKNSSLPAEKFCFPKRLWQVDPAALTEYQANVRLAASKTLKAQLLGDPLLHPEVAALTRSDPHEVVSGKHLCALIFHYIKSKYCLGSITFESFLYRVCKNSSLSALHDLASEIRLNLESSAPTTELN